MKNAILSTVLMVFVSAFFQDAPLALRHIRTMKEVQRTRWL